MLKHSHLQGVRGVSIKAFIQQQMSWFIDLYIAKPCLWKSSQSADSYWNFSVNPCLKWLNFRKFLMEWSELPLNDTSTLWSSLHSDSRGMSLCVLGTHLIGLNILWTSEYTSICSRELNSESDLKVRWSSHDDTISLWTCGQCTYMPTVQPQLDLINQLQNIWMYLTQSLVRTTMMLLDHSHAVSDSEHSLDLVMTTQKITAGRKMTSCLLYFQSSLLCNLHLFCNSGIIMSFHQVPSSKPITVWGTSVKLRQLTQGSCQSHQACYYLNFVP